MSTHIHDAFFGRIKDNGIRCEIRCDTDGCKVYFDGGWIIVRFSGTEPRVRIFAEYNTIDNAKALVRKMAEFTGLPFRD